MTMTSAPQMVEIPPLGLPGFLAAPSETAQAIVVFAHGSGSSRVSPRNAHVARELNNLGLGTLLFDLLLFQEAEDRSKVFNIQLLSQRLASAVDWLQSDHHMRHWAIGLFGASTGAAAALNVAAERRRAVKAVVSRGGRPDLVLPVLPEVEAPTLFIVGGLDQAVIEMNKRALRELTCVKKLEIIPGATHLFEEPGALDLVVAAAKAWFMQHLVGGEGFAAF